MLIASWMVLGEDPFAIGVDDSGSTLKMYRGTVMGVLRVIFRILSGSG